MFSKTITESDRFLSMGTDVQNLYFHLGMQADDDGFVSPKRVMRMVGAAEDSLKHLVAKALVIPFESGVVVITDWKENNYLRSDRYTPTVYTKEMALLEGDNSRYTVGIPLVDAGKDRLGEDSKGKDSLLTDFEEFWKEYPNKVGKPVASKAWTRVASEKEAIIQGLAAWKKSDQWCRDNGRYIPHPSTFLNQRRWEDKPLEKAAPKAFKI